MSGGKKPQDNPGNFTTGLGSVQNHGNNTTYTPNFSAQDQSNLTASSAGQGGFLHQLSKPYDFEQAFNSPFYTSAHDSLSAGINRQYGQDTNNLNADLNAQNQGGSSYAALQHNMLNQNHDFNLGQADNQAHQFSLNAYNQGFNNNLAGLSGLQNYNAGVYQQYYSPLQLASGYQGLHPQYTNAATNRKNTNQAFALAALSAETANAKAAGQAAAAAG